MASAGRWTRIQHFVGKHLPNFNSAFVRLRGLAFPLDLFLTGRARFARKIGEILPLIQADNASNLTENLLSNGRVAVIDEAIPWVENGSLMRFPVSGDMVEVQDITIDGKAIQFVEPAASNHFASERLELFGHPVSLTVATALSQALGVPHEGTSASIELYSGGRAVVFGLFDMVPDSVGRQLLLAGAASSDNNGTFEILEVVSSTSVIIANAFAVGPDANNGAIAWTEAYPVYSLVSTQPIYNGDELWLDYVTYDVVRSVIVGPVPPDDTRYLVTLSKLLPSTLQVDSRVYLRAYPAYESPILPIPEIPFSTRSVGPGLIDWMSGSLYEDLIVDEVQNYRTFDSSFSPLADYRTIDKNHVELSMPIDADSFMFFRPTRGEINWNGSQFVAVADERREFHTFCKLAPELPPSAVPGWTTQVLANTNTRLVIEVEGQVGQSFDLVAGVERTITIVYIGPTERINIAFHSADPNGSMLMRGWVPSKASRVAAVQHVIIGKVTGRYDWAATGLFYKPLWPSLEYLKVRSDVRGGLDGGLLVL